MVGRLRLVVLLVLVLAPMVGCVVAARLVGEITALCIYSVAGYRGGRVQPTVRALPYICRVGGWVSGRVSERAGGRAGEWVSG